MTNTAEDLSPLRDAVLARGIVDAIERRCGPLKKIQGELRTRCPFHDDKDPSLRVDPKKRDGLWNCKPCNKGGDVIQFVMLHDKVSFPEAVRILAREHGIDENTAVAANDDAPLHVVARYEYTDAAGNVAGVKERLEHVPRRAREKRFIWRHVDGTAGKPTPWPATLYRLHEVEAAMSNGMPILLVEGEKCADAVNALGLEAFATTCEDGSKSWTQAHADLLRGARVVIFEDNDKNGRDHGANMFATLQGVARTVAIGKLPGLEDKGDIADWLEEANPAFTPSLQSIIDAALWEGELGRARLDLAALGIGGGPRKHAAPMFAPALTLWDEEDAEVPDLVDGLVPTRGFTVQSSAPKVGKTWVEEEIAVSISTATKAFGVFDTGKKPLTSALILCEDSRRATKRRLGAIAAGKGLTKEQALERVHLVCRPHFDLTNAEDMAWVVASVRCLPEPPAILFIDPLRDAHTGDETDDMDPVTRALRQLITVLDCAVYVNHHNRKTQGNGKESGDPGDEMRGGGELRGRIDAGIYPKKKGGDGVNTFELDVRTEKRDGQASGTFGLKIEIEDENKRAKCVRWTVTRDGKESVATPGQRILAALVGLNEGSPADYFAQSTISKRAGMKHEIAFDTLNELLALGRVERGFGGRGWRLTSGEIGPGPKNDGTDHQT